MGTGDNTRHSRPTAKFDSRELARLTSRDVVTVSIEEVEDVNEWDDDAVEVPVGSQPALIATSRTTTLPDPVTTSVLAEIARRPHAPLAVAPAAPTPDAPESLEQALRAITGD